MLFRSSNITLDWVCPADLRDQPAIVGGKEMDFTYGDCKKEMDMVNKAFIETMIEGDANGRGFQYPIPTYSITRDFDWSPYRASSSAAVLLRPVSSSLASASCSMRFAFSSIRSNWLIRPAAVFTDFI